MLVEYKAGFWKAVLNLQLFLTRAYLSAGAACKMISGMIERGNPMRITLIALTILLLAGCGSSEQGKSTPYRPTTEMMDLMNWILDPSADVIWGNSGWELTAEGERELFPETNAEWDKMVHAAATIAESGNLLMMPGRENGVDGRGEDWIAYSQALVDTGNQLIEASQAQDKQAIFDIGGQLYRVCVACHQRYAYPEQEQ